MACETARSSDRCRSRIERTRSFLRRLRSVDFPEQPSSKRGDLYVLQRQVRDNLGRRHDAVHHDDRGREVHDFVPQVLD